MKRNSSRILTLSARAFIAAVLIACGCGDRQDAPPPVEPPPLDRAPRSTDARIPPRSYPALLTAKVRAVDLEGKPLEGMMPIATLQANAFDKPIAAGDRTGEDGVGTIRIPSDQHLFVRVWDPHVLMFANNFYELFPSDADQAQDMEIAMAPGASLKMNILDTAGRPVVGEKIGLLLVHGVNGPWWPTETTTDKGGAAMFASIPPGKYLIELRTVNHGALEIEETMLPPAGAVDLGVVSLR